MVLEKFFNDTCISDNINPLLLGKGFLPEMIPMLFCS